MTSTFSAQINQALDLQSLEAKRESLDRLRAQSIEDGLEAATAYIDALLARLYQSANEIAIYIFYHSNELLEKALNKGEASTVLGHKAIQLVNLNDIELPHDFIIAGTEERVNKAMLSEYLGICNIEPPAQARLIGCFTYSIPLKFSKEWAEESGNGNLFLPSITFDQIIDLLPDLREDLLYGLEFKSPLSDDLGPVRKLKRSIKEKPLSPLGPYKGSFVCSRANFLEAQAFLREQIPLLLKVEESTLKGVTSRFDASAASGRSKESQATDKRRHTYGTSIERILALGFTYRYTDSQMVDLRSLAKLRELKNSDWKATALRAAVNKQIVITFCSKNYLETLEDWLAHYKRTGNHNLLVFALDKKTHQYCEEHAISSCLTRIDLSKSGLSLLWKKRLLIVHDLVKLGLSVTLTDIDAFWLDDPTSHLFDANFDIVSSVGTKYPAAVYESVGKVLCFGLVCFQPTPKTLRILDECVNKYDQYKDDQKSLNHILSDAGLKIQATGSQSSTVLAMPNDAAETVKLNDSDLTAVTECGLRVKLLSHRNFQRLFDRNHRPIVSHLLSPKDNQSKQYCLERIRDYPPAASQKQPAASQSPVVWLASYPRSGNTMLRGWLKNNFMYDSFSIYNDVHDIGASSEMSRQYGHVSKPWSFKNNTPNDDELLGLNDHQILSGVSYIKTHACFSKGYRKGKTIYIYRNGLNAVASHVQYRLDFGRKGGSVVHNSVKAELESLIVNGAPMCGYWSDNVRTWLEYQSTHSDQCLLLRFEDAVKDFKKTAASIEAFSGSTLIDQSPVLFKNAQKLNPKFFRRGSNNLDFYESLDTLSLFFAFEHEGMHLGGYIPHKIQWFCASSYDTFYPVDKPKLHPKEKEALAYIGEASTTYAKDVRPRQVKPRNRKVNKILEMAQARRAHLQNKNDIDVLDSFCLAMQALLK